VILYAPGDFYAVGQFYESFSQVADEEVIDLLQHAGQTPVSQSQDRAKQGIQYPHQQDVQIPVGSTILNGTLSIPNETRGLVIFAHGSGSSRHSPRNRYVAEVLQSKGVATLLIDLLTQEEEAVDRLTSRLRFDIALLAKRLIDVTQWSTTQRSVKYLPVGYFGASTGAAAALVAASRLSGHVSAVVSRGGRPDLAWEALGSVRAPTLLIVGGRDDAVVTLNQQALTKLRCSKQLALVAGATHLFEEPGTLERAAQLAAEWFVRYLGKPAREEGKKLAVETLR
jgi:putative phosphoribosyl transferase